jgi:hypothetical protein
MDPTLAVEVLNGELKEFVKTPSSTMEPPAVRKLKQWAKAHGFSAQDVRAVIGQVERTATPPVASAPAPLAYVDGDGPSVNELARAYGLEPAWMLDLVRRAGLEVAGAESRIPSDGIERLQRSLAALGYLPHLDIEPHPNGAKPWRAVPPLPVPGPRTVKQSTPKAAPLPKSVTPVVRQAKPVPLAPSLDRTADRAPLTVAKFFYRDVWSSSDLLTVRERMVAWLERQGDAVRAQWWKTTELTWCDEYFGTSAKSYFTPRAISLMYERQCSAVISSFRARSSLSPSESTFHGCIHSLAERIRFAQLAGNYCRRGSESQRGATRTRTVATLTSGRSRAL